DFDRRARLAAQRLRRPFAHLHALGRVGDGDVEPAEEAGDRMARQLGLDRGGVADEQEADLQVPRRDERPVDDDRRARVAAHGVDRDSHVSCQLPVVNYRMPVAGSATWELATGHRKLITGFWKLLLHRLDLTSRVVAAVRADLMRQLGFVALR